MKRINLILPENDKFKLEGIEDKTVPFKNVLRAAISIFQVQSKGFNIAQQREAIKVLDVIEDCEGEILEFEDAQYKFMNNILKIINWTDNIRLFVAVVDSFENPIQEVKDEKSEKEPAKK